MQQTSNTWWIGPLALTILRLLYVEARLSHASSKLGVLVFRAVPAARLLFLIGIIGFSALTICSIGSEEVWLLAMGAAIVIGACFLWPVAITLDDNAIHASVWWRRSIVIPWDQVCGIESKAGGDIQVFAKYGQSITFTRFHIDPSRFQDEVKRRAGLSRIIRSSDPPRLEL